MRAAVGPRGAQIHFLTFCSRHSIMLHLYNTGQKQENLPSHPITATLDI